MSNVNTGYRFVSYGDRIPFADDLPSQDEDVSEFHFAEFYRTMFERQEIWYKRFVLGHDRPWTEDILMKDYKFTNVYRELDRASQWLIKNVLLDDSLDTYDLLFRLIVFRFFNQPDTFRYVDLPHYKDFDAGKLWKQVVNYREKHGNPWHTAYMMNLAFLKKTFTPKKGLFKDYAYCVYLFNKIHKMIPFISMTLKNKSPEEVIKCLERLPAVSHFQSHEFYIDFCYINKYRLSQLNEFNQNSYTNVGSGASLGLRLVFPSLKPNEQERGIYILRDNAESILKQFGEFKYLHWDKKSGKYEVKTDNPNITLHQCEMWLCEYSKYWKMTIGKGKQRSKFSPTTK